MVKDLCDYHLISSSTRYLPFYVYDNKNNSEDLSLFPSENKGEQINNYVRRENINDELITEFNNKYKVKMETNGLIVSGTSPNGRLVEIIELADHPWFVACQFHPEFQSKPDAAHPLFREFIKASLQNKID